MTRMPDLARAATLACRVQLARGLAALPVDPLPLLRACAYTRVYTLDQAVDLLGRTRDDLERLFIDTDAATYRLPSDDGARYIIVYRPDGNPARLRFTLAHELGHRLLGHTGRDAAEEQEADCFASHLLCPEPVIRLLTSVPGDSADRIVAHCYVSRACAATALRRMPSLIAPEMIRALESLMAPTLNRLRSALPKAE